MALYFNQSYFPVLNHWLIDWRIAYWFADCCIPNARIHLEIGMGSFLIRVINQPSNQFSIKNHSINNFDQNIMPQSAIITKYQDTKFISLKFDNNFIFSCNVHHWSLDWSPEWSTRLKTWKEKANYVRWINCSSVSSKKRTPFYGNNYIHFDVLFHWFGQKMWLPVDISLA